MLDFEISEQLSFISLGFRIGGRVSVGRRTAHSVGMHLAPRYRILGDLSLDALAY